MYVYEYDKWKFDQPFLSFQAQNIFFAKSKDCEMTEFSEAEDEEGLDGNTLLLEVEDTKYVYISGLEISEFKTSDKIIDYISLMGNNMIPYAIAIGEKYTYFMYNRYKFDKNEKIQEGTLLNASNDSLDPYDFHLEKGGKEVCKTIEAKKIHNFWPGKELSDIRETEEDDDQEEVEEDGDLIESIYTNGNKEVDKNFIQKCVICLGRNSVSAFRQCGHQCICEDCYRNRGDIDILKCVVCRR